MASRTESQFFWDNQRRIHGDGVPRNRGARMRWAKREAASIRRWLIDMDIARMRAERSRTLETQ